MTTTPRTDDTAQIPWAQTETMPTKTIPYSAPPPAGVGTAPTTAPALNPPTWTGRKTAIAAALAIGISSMGAVAAAVALPVGTSLGGGQVQQGGFGPGGRQQGGFNQPGTQQGGTTQLPGGQLPQGPGQGGPGSMQQAPADPNASTT